MPVPDQVALCKSIHGGRRGDWDFFITDQYETLFNMANLYAQSRRYHEHDLADWFGYAYDRLCDGRRLGQFKGKSSLRTYLYRRGTGVVYRLFLDWLRSRREEMPGGELIDTVLATDDPERQARERDELERVQQAARDLTPARRIAFLVPEFAEALECGDYRFLATVNGAAPDEVDEHLDEVRQRVAFIVERASTDEELACLLYPTEEEIARHRRPTAELRELAPQDEGEELHRFELYCQLRQSSEAAMKKRINKLHAARRYARARMREAVGRGT